MKPREIFALIFFLTLFSSGCALSQDYVLEKKDTSEIRFINKKKFYIYKVEKGETIFSITHKFNVTEADLLEFNPDLKDGLKNKMKLWVPASVAVAAPPVIPEPVTEEKPKGSPLELVLMLPLHIDKQSVTGDLLSDSLLLSENLSKETTASLEFYEGALYALEGHGPEKLKVRIHVLDTQEDTSVAARLLRDPSIQTADMIFVSGGPPILRLVNQFSKLHSVTVASVSMNSIESFRDNPNAILVLPSALTQCHQMGKSIALLNKGAQCFVVRSTNAKEVERGKAFLSGWSEESKNISARELTLDKNFSIVSDSLSTSRHNVLFVPSSNEDFVSALLTTLEQAPAGKNFTLVGIPTWQYFETINPALMEKMNTYLFSMSSVDYDKDAALRFRRHCREKYGNEPSDQSFQGYDVMNLFLEATAKSNKDIPAKLRKQTHEGLYSTYHFVSAGTCTENDFIYVVRYRDYNLEKTDVPK